jgi:uncharacterized protein YegJ (DUF2314 family)
MKEDGGNIIRVCKNCANKKKKETQKNLPALSALVGKYVKKGFEEKGKTEHMWVKITSVNERAGTLIGTLDNDPVVVGNVSCGDEVVVYASEIEQII